MADPAFDYEHISDIDEDDIPEGGTKLKHLNNFGRSSASALKTSYKVEHYNDTGKHKEKYFCVTQSITMSAAATAVELLSNDEVTDDRKVYITAIYGYVAGGDVQVSTTEWLTIKDNANDSQWRIRYDSLKEGDHFNIISRMKNSDNTITWLSSGAQPPIRLGTGATTNKGLKLVGDVNSTGAAVITVTVSGIIK